jgi:hypothetical protein
MGKKDDETTIRRHSLSSISLESLTTELKKILENIENC